MSRTPRLTSKKLKPRKSKINKKVVTPQPKKSKRKSQRSYDDTDLDRIIDRAISVDTSVKKEKNGKKTKKGRKRRETVAVVRSSTTRAKSKENRPEAIDVRYSKSNRALLDDVNSESSEESNIPNKSPIANGHNDIDEKMAWRQQTEKSELELNAANEQITELNEEKQQLLQQLNVLKQEISTIKATNDMNNVKKEFQEITENEIENKIQLQTQQYQQELNQKQMELETINNKHEQEMEGLQSTIENLKFEQMKLNKQLEHKDKLYQHKLQILESDIAGKDAINEQLKTMKSNVEQQLKKQTDITHQLMDELEDTRKTSFNRSRVPRNNSSINLRVAGGTAGGCCSSWWGRPRLIIQNTDSKYKNVQYTTEYTEDEGDNDSHIMQKL